MNAEAEAANVETEQGLTAKCGMFDLTKYINAWENLPPLKPPFPIELPAGEADPAATVGADAPKPPFIADVQIDEINPEPFQA